ncbi:MAG: hypothetical protein Q9175_007143 [Cornicularia normoerica]
MLSTLLTAPLISANPTCTYLRIPLTATATATVSNEVFPVPTCHQALKLNRIIYVGHSYGSIIGNAQATNHPGDICALILTGSGVSIIPVAAHLPQTISFPAFHYAPRFAPSYLVTSSESGRRPYLGGKLGLYDEGIFAMEYHDENVVGLGELPSIDAMLKEAPVSTAPGVYHHGRERRRLLSGRDLRRWAE